MGTLTLINQNIRHVHQKKNLSHSKMPSNGNPGIQALGLANQQRIKAMSATEKKAHFKKSSDKSKQTRKNVQAGLQFPTLRMRRNLKASTKAKVTKEAGIYLAAILEYITAEVVELAGENAIQKKRRSESCQGTLCWP